MQVEEVRNARGETGAAVFRWGRPNWEIPEYDFTNPPYFYQPTNYQIPRGIRNSYLSDRPGADGAQLNKIVCFQSEQVPKFRPDRHYDANIPYFNRYWIDKIQEVDDSINPVKLYIDIEAASDGQPLTSRFIKEAREPIIVIGTYNTRTRRKALFAWHHEYDECTISMGDAVVYMYRTEPKMANAFMKFYREIEPDLVIAYNLWHYDWKYMPARFHSLGVNVNAFSPILQSTDSDEQGFKPKGIATFDMLVGYRYLKRKALESTSLDAVCRKELGRGKRGGLDSSRMAAEWRRNQTAVLDYNIEDVDLMVELDDKLKLSDTYIQFHRVYGLNISDCEHPSNMTGNYIMRRTPLIYPSYQLPVVPFKGADPDVPEVGLHHNLLCLDFSGAYSAAMELGNMDPSTVLDSPTPDCIDIDGVYFKQHSEQLGHYVKIIQDLNQMKSHWAKVKKSLPPMSPEWEQAELIRYAYKVGLLTIYGMTGQKKSRFYNWKIAKSVTFFLRGAIKFATHEAIKAGYKRIYGHTDSVFVQGHGNNLDKLVEQGNKLRDLINKKIPLYAQQYNIKSSQCVPFQIEFEKVARSGFFSKKTRYGLDVWWHSGKVVDPKDAIEIKGFDSLRGDTPPYAKPIQKQLISDILHGRMRREIDQEIREKLNPIKAGKIDMFQLAVPNEMQKDIDKYPKGHPHAVGAIFSNRFLGTGFERGSKARLLPVKTNGIAPAQTPYVCIDETVKALPDWVKVDWDACYRKVLAKVGLVYESAGWDIGSINGQMKLFDFPLSEV